MATTGDDEAILQAAALAAVAIVLEQEAALNSPAPAVTGSRWRQAARVNAHGAFVLRAAGSNDVVTWQTIERWRRAALAERGNSVR